MTVIAAMLMTVAAAPASAKTRQFSAEFTLKATNGYWIDADAEGGKANLFVSQDRSPNHLFLSDTYEAPARVSRQAIQADFGILGEVVVRFSPSGKKSVTKLKCGRHRRRIVRNLGTFSGTIRFEGEGGYTDIETDHANGSVGPPLACVFIQSVSNGNSGSHYRRPKGAYLGATTSSNSLGFSAYRGGSQRRTQYSAQSSESAGSVSIERFASVTGPPHSFIFDNALSSATVMPPPPFIGRATFQRVRGRRPSWTGSLGVSFPGASALPLTGPDFTVLLTRGP